MDSNTIKQTVMRQVQLESNTSNARMLIEKMNDVCFEKCLPKPGSSVSSGEQTCFTSCMEVSGEIQKPQPPTQRWQLDSLDTTPEY
ncbi:protein translocase subunit [Diaporthe eres]|uniref:Mitochondrial import inner membrane translocase subunit n=1 Tax=Diaporthe vaccinii TaxID=105482 RepID=A0ABR4DS58_9PEZI|nr:mitochondrial import inner membrane translocase subunit TIM13 [Diaporthe eres]